MDVNDPINDALIGVFLQMQAQYGKVVNGVWFNEEAECPGCGRPIDALKTKKGDVLSLNIFIYGERGILIGYFLCSRCAKEIFKAAKRNPGVQTARHDTIEANLTNAYLKHMNSMDA
ncbi:MAG: hypothetical protein HND44_01150 [Chloroflexi bacterium]|nr:hypothetical protein [Ardenticatenaceae bacterium]MBL1127106.1 hypothetical protein [Chloroflexota bacterium]NOG33167.1 hypothetical protein [Chloroflexota bacterium]GIK54961.1 MAG: hypothetical protein BroJett015_06240 [Chloroflexota bacterium]